jgi:RNA-binding protein YlmH
VELDELKVRAKVVKEQTCVEASTRLDAIGSAGLGISRSRMAKVVEAGDVTVNFKQVKSSSASLKTGDVIMAKNIGRLDITEITETRKGKIRAKVVKTV